MNVIHSVLIVAVAAVVTSFLRFLPFIVLREGRILPPFILWLGRVLPFAIMGMLCVYCLRGVSFDAANEWIPSLVGVTAVVVLHIWRRSTLLSILGGTVCYMLLVQLAF